MPDLTSALDTPVTEYAERAYLEYAMSVVKGRAIPHFYDGLKPVQRRILFSMHELGLTTVGRYVKSARVVGDVIGKYHPHGDSAVYDAMARMAQPFSLLHPLVDGQGNFGSLEGDAPAAARYTEARLGPSAELLLHEVQSGNVEFGPNYDGERREPRVLPALAPMLLVNGAAGVGVGMACQIPSHNLLESARAAALLIKKPTASLDEVLAYLPGPDFPSGGQLVTAPGAIRDAYATGRGTLRVRAKYAVEPLARGQWRLAVTELPPDVSVSKVITEIDGLLNPGSDKKLSVAQLKLKATAGLLIDAIRDESDRNNPVRLVVEPKTGKVEPEVLVAFLLAHTSLESNVSLNMVVVDKAGTPRSMTLLELLADWAEARVAHVRRRLEHERSKVLDRLHILAGRKQVLLSLDAVIKLIRESDEPKPELMRVFGLSERQAEDILELRLRQLSRLEGISLDKEIAERTLREQEIKGILDNDHALKGYTVADMGQWAKKHQQPRRTRIEAAEAVRAELPQLGEPVTVFVTKNGWMRVRPGANADPAQLSFKPNDSLLAAVNLDPGGTLTLLYASGRAFSIGADRLHPGRDFVPLATQISPESGDLPVGAWAAGDTRILVASKDGYGFVGQTSDLVARQKAGKSFATAGSLLPPLVVPAEDALVLVTSGSHRLAFELAEIKLLSGGRGVQLLKLRDGEAMEQVAIVASGDRSVADCRGRRASAGKPLKKSPQR